MHVLRLLAVASIFAAPIALSAESITYTDTFTASGSIGAETFTDALVTISGTGNSSGIINEGGGIFALSLPVTFSIAGVASGTFTDDIQVFANQSSGIAGFGDNTNDFALIYTANPALSSYSLSTGIGPVTGPSLFNSVDATLGEAVYGTNDGNFALSSVSDSTFQASPVPEPSSLALFGTGALGILGVVRRKFGRA
ncbi:PEP-CTERM sorting domain-containing protein [Edaphobacter modestus]|uniref:Putative secreted protein with PEP-CTERM sorting signal n=1 Tax=Edaphobacter modestus TaxID=388466 RepID=A0A4Q7YXJ5_9BACT|nr:PEP-CTERM sorting domain-containing protein [Edaphobacter modestus]RZU42480.1 putative secreted protein with PEP-CTERM sorting signal [Edaphobacter modestus]